MKQGFDTTKRFEMNPKVLPTFVGILSVCLASTAYAQPLIGNGLHLPHEPLVQPLHDLRAISLHDPEIEFIGEWPGRGPLTALPDWWGTFHADGPVPGSGDPPGITIYDDFTDLALGYLPANTMFRFGDVDAGSGTTETFTLNAWAPDGSPITTPWLNVPLGVWGNGSGPGGDPAMIDMPGWAFNAGEYIIDGTTVDNNPSIAFILQTNESIGMLSVDESGPWGANFHLAAPVPGPATPSLLALGGLALLRRRR